LTCWGLDQQKDLQLFDDLPHRTFRIFHTSLCQNAENAESAEGAMMDIRLFQQKR